MALNVTNADLSAGQRIVATPSLVQWDEGQKLTFTGAELPQAFRVDFSCRGDSSTIPGSGTPAGVDIPNDLLKAGKPILAYVVLYEGQDDRETEYWITINVKSRPVPTGVTPTPEEAGIIDQYIRDLSAAATRAEAAAEAIEDMSVEAETLAAGSAATVEKTVDPETGEITLSFGIPQGEDGDPGAPGDDGVSPIVSVQEIPGGHRVTITDAQGAHVFDVMDGQGGSGAVQSVNGKTGVVELDAGDIDFDDQKTYGNGTVGKAVSDVNQALTLKQDATSYVTLSGTTVTQTGADNTMYLCGELAELTFTAPQTGMTAVRFTSGSTPTVVTFSGVTAWLNGFDPDEIEASKTYEINILNGVGCAAWT